MIPPIQYTLSYKYTKFQANPLTFDTQNACFGEHVLVKFDIEKRAQTSPACRKPVGASVIAGLSYSVIAQTFAFVLNMRRRM